MAVSLGIAKVSVFEIPTQKILQTKMHLEKQPNYYIVYWSQQSQLYHSTLEMDNHTEVNNIPVFFENQNSSRVEDSFNRSEKNYIRSLYFEK